MNPFPSPCPDNNGGSGGGPNSTSSIVSEVINQAKKTAEEGSYSVRDARQVITEGNWEKGFELLSKTTVLFQTMEQLLNEAKGVAPSAMEEVRKLIDKEKYLAQEAYRMAEEVKVIKAAGIMAQDSVKIINAAKQMLTEGKLDEALKLLDGVESQLQSCEKLLAETKGAVTALKETVKQLVEEGKQLAKQVHEEVVEANRKVEEARDGLLRKAGVNPDKLSKDVLSSLPFPTLGGMTNIGKSPMNFLKIPEVKKVVIVRGGKVVTWVRKNAKEAADAAKQVVKKTYETAKEIKGSKAVKRAIRLNTAVGIFLYFIDTDSDIMSEKGEQRELGLIHENMRLQRQLREKRDKEADDVSVKEVRKAPKSKHANKPAKRESPRHKDYSGCDRLLTSDSPRQTLP